MTSTTTIRTDPSRRHRGHRRTADLRRGLRHRAVHGTAVRSSRHRGAGSVVQQGSPDSIERRLAAQVVVPPGFARQHRAQAGGSAGPRHRATSRRTPPSGSETRRASADADRGPMRQRTTRPRSTTRAGLAQHGEVLARVGVVDHEVGRRALLEGGVPARATPGPATTRRPRASSAGMPYAASSAHLAGDPAVRQHAARVGPGVDRHAGLVGRHDRLAAPRVQVAHRGGVRRELLGRLVGVLPGSLSSCIAVGTSAVPCATIAVDQVGGQPGAVLDAVDAGIDQASAAPRCRSSARSPWRRARAPSRSPR